MILYKTKFLELRSAKSKNGNNWYYAHRPNIDDIVVILPIINNEKILFLIEERPPIQAENIAKYTIAIPAGLVGDEREGESVEDAIKAELLEEAGLKAHKIEIKARKVASSSGCVSETFTIAFAYIDEYKIFSTPINDGGVIVDRVLVDIKDLKEWMGVKTLEGMILTSHTLSALYYLMEDLNK